MFRPEKRMIFLVTGLMIIAMLVSACGGAGNKAADEKTYPSKPVTFIAPSGAGGAFDQALRAITKVLNSTKIVEQQLLVEAKPGGGGSVFLAEYATNDKTNDYKLFLTSPVILVNNLKKEGSTPFGYKNTTPLAQFFVDYAVIAVRADSKYNDLKSLFNDMKADPSKLAVAGGSAPGSVDHLAILLPAKEYGIDVKKMKYIVYDGKAESMVALLGGNADVLSSVTASVASYLEAGKIKVLAVAAPQRLPGVFKDVPTLGELGIDGDFVIWRGVFGPEK
ncbi:Bug family tripartite tricarboxylate transporter substrate binding protein [Acetonema longum]|uniref:Bug family tripartite tricarboxylate transporter substrate binding protein n=1 Tax=Acetonema longum TaxID=2374 RepID=UPI0002FD26DD|nr:tripartite tricarboxylate transporter substrate binding protein [Acetonema longum]